MLSIRRRKTEILNDELHLLCTYCQLHRQLRRHHHCSRGLQKIVPSYTIQYRPSEFKISTIIWSTAFHFSVEQLTTKNIRYPTYSIEYVCVQTESVFSLSTSCGYGIFMTVRSQPNNFWYMGIFF